MAYGNNNRFGGNSGGNTQRQSQSSGGGKKEFVEDPNKLGILWEKSSEKAGTYFSGTVTKAIPEGAKVMIYVNKVKNRTDKTPTHVLKLAKPRS